MGKPKFSPEELAQHILDLLPPDGTPVLNRVMQVMLARRLEKAIEPTLYFKARDHLLKRGKIGRSRGQGGQVFLAIENSRPERAADGAAPFWSEAKLMEPLQRYLLGQFRELLDLPRDSLCMVENTSTTGPSVGRWARPDFILVTATRLKFLPGSQVDVHSFELKTEMGATDLAVYEALAQTRFTHFGHLVWHLPIGSRAEVRLPEIERQCDEHGIGLIRMHDAEKPACEIRLDPVRKTTLPLIVDGFLESRLKPHHQEKLFQINSGTKK